jgi:transposase, IS30 family
VIATIVLVDSGFSAEQKLDVWRRWKAGRTLLEIGRAFGKEHSSIRCLVSRTVGLLRPSGGVRSSLDLCIQTYQDLTNHPEF